VDCGGCCLAPRPRRETQNAPGWRAKATHEGLEESLRRGVTAVADVTTSPQWKGLYPDEREDVFSFLELIGLAAPRMDDLQEKARGYLAGRSPSRIQRGISPHAPYTVRVELLQRLCVWSAQKNFPLAMHLAETREELEFLQSRSGPLLELLSAMNAWDDTAIPRPMRPLDYLKILAESHRALVIHGNYFTPLEMEFLASHRDRLSVVYCPRTHAYFGHRAYPLSEMLNAGVRVALGTDSRASNPDLSVMHEMRHLARYRADVPPNVILRLGTLAGAEALDAGNELAVCGQASERISSSCGCPTMRGTIRTRPCSSPVRRSAGLQVRPTHVHRRWQLKGPRSHDGVIDLPEEEKAGLKLFRIKITESMRFEKPAVYIQQIQRSEYVVAGRPEQVQQPGR